MACMVVFAITACQSAKEKKPQAAEDNMTAAKAGSDSLEVVSITPEQYRMAGITLGNITQQKLNASLSVNGKVDVPPQSKISITFPYGGFVRKINVLEGKYVKKGSLLAVLENPDYVDLQENYLKNKSALEYARQEYERQQKLYQADVAAGKSYQKATSEYHSLEASVNAMAQKLKMLDMDPVKLKADDIRSTVNIFAPDNGYVTKIEANQGKYINAQQELMEMDNTRNTHIDLTVYEKDIHAVKANQEVTFTLAGNNQQEQRARIILIGREIGPDRSVIVHAVPLGSNNYYLPGAYVQAQIKLNNVLSDVLPEEAVVRSEGERYIFYKVTGNEDSALHFRMLPVKVGVEEGGFIQVTLPGNISIPDSSIVTNGAFSLLSVLKNTGEED